MSADPPDEFAGRVLESMMQVQSKKKRKTKWGGNDNQNYLTHILLDMRAQRTSGRQEFFVRQQPEVDLPRAALSLCSICLRSMPREMEYEHLNLHWAQVRFILHKDAEKPCWDYTDVRAETIEPTRTEEADEKTDEGATTDAIP